MTLVFHRPAPRLMPAREASDPLVICFGAVPPTLEAPEAADEFFQATASAYLYRQPGIWAACVEGGRSALFEALSPLNEEMFWYLAITNVAAAAGYQRGMFPLHGSGVLFPDGVVAFMGTSGVGKTTATAGLVARGYPLFADDLCLIRPDGGGFAVGRGAPEIRLVRDAAEALGWDCGETIGHQRARDKFAFIRETAPVDSAPMCAMIELAFADGPPRLDRLDGVAQVRALMASLRLRMGLPLFPAARRTAGFALVTEIARKIPTYRFTRPRSYGAFDAGLDMLIKTFGR